MNNNITYSSKNGRKYITLELNAYKISGTAKAKMFDGSIALIRMTDIILPLTEKQLEIMKSNAAIQRKEKTTYSQQLFLESCDEIKKNRMTSHLPPDDEIIRSVNDGGYGCQEILGADIELYEVYGTTYHQLHSEYTLENGELILKEKYGEDCTDTNNNKEN